MQQLDNSGSKLEPICRDKTGLSGFFLQYGFFIKTVYSG